MEEMKKGLKGLRVNELESLEQQSTEQPTMITHNVATYVAEDGNVGPQLREMPLGLRVFDGPV